MIIWDDKNQKHLIRIRGNVQGTFDPAKVSFASSDKTIESTAKSQFDSDLAGINTGKKAADQMVVRMQVNNKSALSKTLDYVLYCGPGEPPANWWETAE